MKWFRQKRKELAPHLKTGIRGEKIAEKALKAAGMKLLGRRVRVGRHDEVDLLFRDGETLVLVEVKTRRSIRYGRPVTAVNRKKQQALSRAAVHLLQSMKKKPRYIRFDVVEVMGDPEWSSTPEINHIKNAFPLDSKYQLSFQ